MATAANAPRLAATRLLSHQVDAVAIAVGMVLKEYRDYSHSPNKPSKTQTAVAREARSHQRTISHLETGKGTPSNAVLKRILKSIGLNTKTKEGSAVFALLCVVRDQRKRIEKLEEHQPT